MHESNDRPVAWVVQADPRRDYSAAEKWGNVRYLFSSIGRNFDPKAVIEAARNSLSKIHEDDYLVMAGDPALCAVAVTVAAEYLGSCNILRWDRNKLNYSAMTLVF